MKIIRTLIAFVLGMAVGYALHAWNVELPQEVRSYAQQIEKMKKDKEALQAELERLRKLTGKE
jgi:cell division protein FtsB